MAWVRGTPAWRGYLAKPDRGLEKAAGSYCGRAGRCLPGPWPSGPHCVSAAVMSAMLKTYQSDSLATFSRYTTPPYLQHT